ncbi:peptidoglycan editing factor PgeF [Aquabacterium sp.]|uniref:peptidoglycan editing factor PgeF n=1 Tax=Aquabacterium sp. TaxID=1872578 RepID=UPI0024886BEE|nr:peptidoglycan editing factor PgeF [Aquabacterium sp.]MDI1349358.1 peptidoglycan editing factor PgeF [Aquabacterium sp.]
MSARAGGISQPPWDSCNLGDHVQDDAEAVRHNRAVFAQHLGAQPVWLQQVHGDRVLRLSADNLRAASTPIADGALTTEPGIGCVVMVADCLPLLLAAPEGRGVAALHAGWRGLAGAGQGMAVGRGIVHSGVAALCEAASCGPADLSVWLGPCIGPAHFEVGPDVLAGFGVDPTDAARTGAHPRFAPRAAGSASGDVGGDVGGGGKWLADLPGLARDILRALGVRHITGGDACTVSDATRFFSYRRDGRTGRQAAGICLR